jgi:predicted nucleic acid-binding Zn finger protein
MQQLTIEHENTTAKKDRRSGKGRVIALSRRIYCLLQTDDVFYVESESTDNVYYYVKFKPDVIEWCSCCDNSMRGMKCKHLFAIEFAIQWGTLRDIDQLPSTAATADVKREDTQIAQISKSYKDDDYTF